MCSLSGNCWRLGQWLGAVRVPLDMSPLCPVAPLWPRLLWGILIWVSTSPQKCTFHSEGLFRVLWSRPSNQRKFQGTVPVHHTIGDFHHSSLHIRCYDLEIVVVFTNNPCYSFGRYCIIWKFPNTLRCFSSFTIEKYHKPLSKISIYLKEVGIFSFFFFNILNLSLWVVSIGCGWSIC